MFTVQIETTITNQEQESVASQNRFYDVADLASLTSLFENASKAMVTLTEGVKIGLDVDNS